MPGELRHEGDPVTPDPREGVLERPACRVADQPFEEHQREAGRHAEQRRDQLVGHDRLDRLVGDPDVVPGALVDRVPLRHRLAALDDLDQLRRHVRRRRVVGLVVEHRQVLDHATVRAVPEPEPFRHPGCRRLPLDAQHPVRDNLTLGLGTVQVVETVADLGGDRERARTLHAFDEPLVAQQGERVADHLPAGGERQHQLGLPGQDPGRELLVDDGRAQQIADAPCAARSALRAVTRSVGLAHGPTVRSPRITR